MALILVRLTFSYVNWRPSLRTGQGTTEQIRRTSSVATQTNAACWENAGLLTQVVKAPLRTEANLPLQVVGMLRPRLQDTKSFADTRLGHRQFVLTWEARRECEEEKKTHKHNQTT